MSDAEHKPWWCGKCAKYHAPGECHLVSELSPGAGLAIPRAQALIFQPELTHSVWIDVMHRKRSRRTLEAWLRKEVRAGRYVGYRLIAIECEYIGISWSNNKADT